MIAKFTRFLVVLAVAAGIHVGCGKSTDSTPPPPQSFAFADVEFQSDEESLRIEAVRGTTHPGYTDWSVILRCAADEPFRGDVRLTVHYRAGGAEERATFRGSLELEPDATGAIGGVTRPAVNVDSVERVLLRVLGTQRGSMAGARPVA